MPATKREIIEGLQEQGINESIPYRVSCSALATAMGVTTWGIESCTVYDFTDTPDDPTDVTATVMPSGSASNVGSNVISLPPLTALTLDHLYLIELILNDGGNAPKPGILIYVRAQR